MFAYCINRYGYHRLRLYRSQGNLNEAEKMYQWALQGYDS